MSNRSSWVKFLILKNVFRISPPFNVIKNSLENLFITDNNEEKKKNQKLGRKGRVILLLEHHKFFNHASIGIPVRSLLQVRLLTHLNAQQIETAPLLDGIQIKQL